MRAKWKLNSLLRRICAASTTLFECAMISAQSPPANPPTRIQPVSVPFVGCPSNGQLGPLKAPSGASQTVAIPIGQAQRLAYYKAENGLGVLAPRGWHCFGTYGSDGSTLYAAPEQIDGELFSGNWRGFSGPAVQVSSIQGGTSGRFEVARVIARIFPSHMDFVKAVIAEGIEPAADFPVGPYPADKLVYSKSNTTVEFETPANLDGLGTASRFVKNGEAIYGVAILVGEENDLILLSARIPNNGNGLTGAIIGQVEEQVAATEPAGR
jgi:hypothetical protein